MSYPDHVTKALQGARHWESCYAPLGTNIQTMIFSLATKGTIIVVPRHMHAVAQNMDRPPAPARLLTPSPQAVRKFLSDAKAMSKGAKYHTVVLFMDGISRGPATWRELAALIKDKRLIIVSGG